MGIGPNEYLEVGHVRVLENQTGNPCGFPVYLHSTGVSVTRPWQLSWLLLKPLHFWAVPQNRSDEPWLWRRTDNP